jgi:hypothetical protein
MEAMLGNSIAILMSTNKCYVFLIIARIIAKECEIYPEYIFFTFPPLGGTREI